MQNSDISNKFMNQIDAYKFNKLMNDPTAEISHVYGDRYYECIITLCGKEVASKLDILSHNKIKSTIFSFN